jgi:hypothetical protein
MFHLLAREVPAAQLHDRDLPVASINAALVAPSRDASCGYVCPIRTVSQS